MSEGTDRTDAVVRGPGSGDVPERGPENGPTNGSVREGAAGERSLAELAAGSKKLSHGAGDAGVNEPAYKDFPTQHRLDPWQREPRAGIITKAGSAEAFETGDWKSFRPIWRPEHCIHCLFCWIYCPDDAVILDGKKMAGFDYHHCKGCGICAHECPTKIKAIEMVPELEAAEQTAG